MTLLELLAENERKRADTKPLTEAEVLKLSRETGAELSEYFAKNPRVSPLVKLGLVLIWGVNSGLALHRARELDQAVEAERRRLEEQRQ